MPTTPRIRNKMSGVDTKPAAEYVVTFREKGFDVLYMYTLVYEWLVDNGWHDRDNDTFFPEIAYVERDGGGGKEIWVYWKLSNNYDDAPEGFANKKMDITFHCLSIKSEEMVIKGKKIKTQKGEFEINVKAYLELNYKKYWEQNKIPKFFQDIMMKRTIKRKVEKWRDNVRSDALRLREAINIYLKIPHYTPEKEGGEFWVKRTGE